MPTHERSLKIAISNSNTPEQARFQNPTATPTSNTNNLLSTCESTLACRKPSHASNNCIINKRVTFSNKIDTSYAQRSNLSGQTEIADTTFVTKRYSSSNIDTLKKLNKSISLLKSSINKDIEHIDSSSQRSFDCASNQSWLNNTCVNCSCFGRSEETNCRYCGGQLHRKNEFLNKKSASTDVNKAGTVLPIIHDTHTNSVQIEINAKPQPKTRHLESVNEAFALDTNLNYISNLKVISKSVYFFFLKSSLGLAFISDFGFEKISLNDIRIGFESLVSS